MFRKFLAVFSIACLACTFVACSSPGKVEKKDNAEIENAKPTTEANSGGDEGGGAKQL